MELKARDLTGPLPAFRRASPLVILNACQTGAQGLAFTGLGGWANSLINSGASAVIGTLWSVSDSACLTFTKEFYPLLSKGMAMGEAMQTARLKSRQGGDPSWLAYQLYAHPNATMRLGTPQ